MSTDREVTRIVRSWLNEDRHEDADRVLDTVLAELETTPQRRSWWSAWRHPVMNTTMRFALVAAAIVIVALIGYQLIAGPNVGGPQATPSPTVDLTPVELPAAGALEAGTYFVRNPYVDEDPVRSCESGCADYQRIIFTLPDGWATSDGFVHKEFGKAGEVAFSVWTPGETYLDPCHWQESAVGPLGHSHDASGAIVLDDQFALLNQVGRPASAPTIVTLGGQAAVRIELSIPAELDIATCDRREFRSWSEWDVVDFGNSHHASGQIDVVYVVDVDRRPLVIDASHMPGASEEDLAEFEAILASMIIER